MLDLFSKGMVSNMFKSTTMKTSRFLVAALTSVICLPLAGCLNTGDPLGEGSMAYTVDEMYPIAARKPCGQNWPDLANDTSNHFSPNHGCAVHANIAAMVADPTVLSNPRPLGPTPANTAAAAILIYEYNSGSLSSGSSFGGTSGGAAKP
jgi:predicted small secreted protein